MPGIAGIISDASAERCQDLVRAMTRSMLHEGSYTQAVSSVPETSVYAGWVAMNDSFAAGQVFFNEEKDIALIFAGECYADANVRKELISKGHEIAQSRGDWLVHLYEEEEDEFFEKLNGLFCGLLIDRRKNTAFLFNDRYGAERIYYYETNGATYFASEAKALLRVLPELRAFE